MFLNSVLDGRKNPGTHWTGDWVDPRAGLDIVAKGKILSNLYPVKWT
jgi:hypothetical protein